MPSIRCSLVKLHLLHLMDTYSWSTRDLCVAERQCKEIPSRKYSHKKMLLSFELFPFLRYAIAVSIRCWKTNTKRWSYLLLVNEHRPRVIRLAFKCQSHLSSLFRRSSNDDNNSKSLFAWFSIKSNKRFRTYSSPLSSPKVQRCDSEAMRFVFLSSRSLARRTHVKIYHLFWWSRDSRLHLSTIDFYSSSNGSINVSKWFARRAAVAAIAVVVVALYPSMVAVRQNKIASMISSLRNRL